MKKATLIIESWSRKPVKLNLSYVNLLHIKMALKYDGKSYKKVDMNREGSMRFNLLKKIETAMKPSRKR